MRRHRPLNFDPYREESEAAEKARLFEEVTQLVASLATEDQKLIDLMFYRGESIRSTASLMGWPVGRIVWRRVQILESLKIKGAYLGSAG
jgi:DNA-directed RNA polymerase specialized sigma24 family protein